MNYQHVSVMKQAFADLLADNMEHPLIPAIMRGLRSHRGERDERGWKVDRRGQRHGKGDRHRAVPRVSQQRQR